MSSPSLSSHILTRVDLQKNQIGFEDFHAGYQRVETLSWLVVLAFRDTDKSDFIGNVGRALIAVLEDTQAFGVESMSQIAIALVEQVVLRGHSPISVSYQEAAKHHGKLIIKLAISVIIRKQ